MADVPLAKTPLPLAELAGADTATVGQVPTSDGAGAVAWGTGGTGIVDAGGPVTIAKIWSGSQAQYDALGTYDADTLYFTPEA